MSTPKTGMTGPQTKTVKITPPDLNNPNSLPSVDPPGAVQISKSNHDQVEWTCKDKKFTVDFKEKGTGSPFSSVTYPDQNGKASSGSAKSDAEANGKQYRYSVTVDGRTLDPVIVLQN